MNKLTAATIYDVAKLAGVSVKTVSRVINNDGSVKASNVDKVQSAILQLNYKPDLNARRLRSKQSYLIVILYTEYSGNFYSELVISGAVAACDELGYDLILRPVNSNSTKTAGDLVRHVIERSNPDGFVLIPPFSYKKDIQGIITSYNKPLVCLSPNPGMQEQGVGCDEVKGAYDATSYLISLGHTRIGLVNYLLGHAAGTMRREGYLQAHADANIAVDEALVIEHTFDISSIENDIRKMLACDRPPTGIFAVNDFLAGTIYRIASQLKVRIPHDLSVIGFDDDPGAQFLWPPLTTVRQPVRELGHEAVKLLIKRFILKHNIAPIPLLPCELIKRKSTSPNLL